LILRLSALILLAIVAFACSSASKKSDVQTADAQAADKEEQQFTDGLEAMKEGDYDDAISIFEKFQAQHLTSRYSVPVQYNWGIALENLKRWSEAIEKFRFVIETSRGKAPPQEAQALYHSALCYEALGDDSKSVGALLDALNRKQYFSEEAVVEINARLASAYARVGNEKQADLYYKRAESGLAAMKRKTDGVAPPSWLGKTLYNMGKMPLKKLAVDDFLSGLKPLERGQIWLLRAAELGDEVWAPKASFELIQAYRDAWAVIESVPLKESDDQLLAMKEQQDLKISMAVTLHELISRLKIERLPDESKPSQASDEIFAVLETILKDVESLTGTRPVQQALTPEANEREGIKREGTMVPIKAPSVKKPKARKKRKLRK
jgi:tetratricopeptide (TPR) repeat protein